MGWRPDGTVVIAVAQLFFDDDCTSFLRIFTHCSLTYTTTTTTMSSQKPFVLRWGILGCGRISGSFVRDLVLPPSEHGVSESDVAHAITAVGSRTLAKANEFVKENCPKGAWAQIQELVGDDVDVKAVEGYENVVKLAVSSLLS